MYQHVTNMLHTKGQLACDSFLATDELPQTFSEGLSTYNVCFIVNSVCVCGQLRNSSDSVLMAMSNAVQQAMSISSTNSLFLNNT